MKIAIFFVAVMLSACGGNSMISNYKDVELPSPGQSLGNYKKPCTTKPVYFTLLKDEAVQQWCGKNARPDNGQAYSPIFDWIYACFIQYEDGYLIVIGEKRQKRALIHEMQHILDLSCLDKGAAPSQQTQGVKQGDH